MLFDTHAHVNFSAYKEDAEEVIKRALMAGVWINNVGTQIDTSRAAVEMAQRTEQLLAGSPQLTGKVFAVIGLHPVHTYQQMLDEEESHFQTRAEKFDYETYKKLAADPKVVGIGECGLDYYRLPADGDIEKIKQQQKEAFIAQIKLAKELNKALVIHCRPGKNSQDAYEDILKILDAEILDFKSEVRFEIHSFTGSPEIVQEFLKRGAFVGFNGITTFDKTGEMQKNVETVPLDKIVLETDSPYLSPIPFRGKRNEPAYVKYVAEKIARVKNISFDEVADATLSNAKKLFILH